MTERPDDSPTPTLIARARRAYELARLRRAFVHALPALFLFVVLVIEGARDGVSLAASLAMYPTSVLALYLGQGAGAAVLPSLLFGLVPFAIVRVAESSGHVCLGEACVSWCLPACVLGGAGGGALVALRGRKERDRFGYSIAAVTLVVLAGAVGCRCAGNAGLLGIALGTLAGTALPWLALRPASSRD